MIAKNLFITAAFLAASSSTQASVLLDFEGVGAGASINDYYNGGTDSQGNAGVNYGVRFVGGTAVKDSLGNTRVQGAFTIEFPTRPDITGIVLQATRTTTDGGFAQIYGDHDDAMWIEGYYLGNLISYNHRTSITNLTRMTLDQVTADNLYFLSDTWTGPAVIADPPTDLPEPGAAALLLAGLLAWNGRSIANLLSRRRRYESDPKHSYRCGTVLPCATF